MRNALCSKLASLAPRPKFVFLTGDLGFMALEPLRESLGERFINAGISEQNMVGVAAGLAKDGLEPWVYSIAPFIYARAYEQIRNDVALHDLPVRLVANGGGYGYGVMGSTHHAIEDYGALLCLQNMRVFVPAFSEDVSVQIDRINNLSHPSYLRLGRDEKPTSFVLPEYAPWRKLVDGDGSTLLVVGPLVGPLLDPIMSMASAERPNLWVVSELPIVADTVPSAFYQDLDRSGKLIVAEEHVETGSVGQSMAALILRLGLAAPVFRHRFAAGYPSGRYGSQSFHRKESGLDAESLVELVRIQ